MSPSKEAFLVREG